MSTSDSPPKETAEEFMSRWSRRKQQAREEVPAPATSQSRVDAGPAPELPPVEELGMDSDYRDFFHPKVKEGVRRAALKKLFSDPHFSVMDGMDIYLDDYSITEEIPAAMMAELKQAQNILGWAKEDREAEAARERALAEGAVPPAIAEAGPAAVDPVDVPAEAEVVEIKQEAPDDGSQTA